MRTLLIAFVALLLTRTAPAQGADEAALRTAIACLADTLGLTPAWHITVTVVNDSTARYYGLAEANPFSHNADITYNLAMIRAHAQPLRDIALHEVLHVVLSDLTQMARVSFDERIASYESERTVRALVRWPVWRDLCVPRR